MKTHYFLVAAEVMFRDPASDNAIGSIKLNTMIRSNAPCVPSSLIGKAQQAAQLSMFKKLGDVQLEVFDVFIISISPLGEMTEEEFLAPADNTHNMPGAVQ